MSLGGACLDIVTYVSAKHVFFVWNDVKLAELMTAQVFFGVDGIYIDVFTHIQKNGTLSTSTGDLNLGWMNLFSLHKKTDLFLSSELKHKKNNRQLLDAGW